MASGLKRLPVGNFGAMMTQQALPTKQLRTPVTFPLPPNPTLPNPVAIPLPSAPTGIPAPPQPKGAGQSGLGSGDRLDMATQGVGYWRVDVKSNGIGEISVNKLGTGKIGDVHVGTTWEIGGSAEKGYFEVGEPSQFAQISDVKITWRIFSSIPHKWQGE